MGGVELPLLPYYLVSLPVSLLLMALVWIPAFVRRLGPRLLPLVVVLESGHLLVVKAILVGWLVSAPHRTTALTSAVRHEYCQATSNVTQ